MVLSGHRDAVVSAVYSSDGRRIVTASKRQDRARLGRRHGQTNSGSDRRDWTLFSRLQSDGARIVTALADKTARVWDVATGKQTLVLTVTRERGAFRVVQSRWPRMSLASADSTARVWNAATGQELIVLMGQ